MYESTQHNPLVNQSNCGATLHDPTVISMFSGCGGSSTGYRMAGYRVCAAVEWEQNSVDTYRLNHPQTLVFHQDIATVTGGELLAATGLSVGELDILDGSPPCQGFSTVGKRIVDDPRNTLFKEYVRLLTELQPKVMVMENVSGLVKGKMKPVFVDILTTLRESGYNVNARLMTASNYGVPQKRQRVIFIGVRQDLGIVPSFPAPFTTPIPLRDALKDLPQQLEALRPTGSALKLAQSLKPGEDGADLRKRYGYKPSDFSLQRLSWHKVAPTVCKTIRPGQCGLLHPDEQRYLSTAELKRICSFPDDYQFAGSLEEHWARMGNSVPPLLMKAIAGHIRDEILPHA